MTNRKDLTGQRFGNRLIIRDKCVPDDWVKIGKPVPIEPKKYSLGKCLNCGSVFPTLRRNLALSPLERCVYCSNIGNHHGIESSLNRWIIDGDIAVCEIDYHGGKVNCVIDADRYDDAKEYQWRISKKKRKYYVVAGSFKKGTMIYLHQLILGKPEDGNEIDHKDGDSLNNRISNLRYVTHQGNVDNIRHVRTDNSLGIRGVSFDREHKKYVVDFSYHSNRIYVKPWKTIEEAIYCRKCLEENFGINTIEINDLCKKYGLYDENRKNDIKKYVDAILEKKGMKLVCQ